MKQQGTGGKTQKGKLGADWLRGKKTQGAGQVWREKQAAGKEEKTQKSITA